MPDLTAIPPEFVKVAGYLVFLALLLAALIDHFRQNQPPISGV